MQFVEFDELVEIVVFDGFEFVVGQQEDIRRVLDTLVSELVGKIRRRAALCFPVPENLVSCAVRLDSSMIRIFCPFLFFFLLRYVV